MSAYMKYFTPSKKSVPDPNGGMINYPEICIDTNPRFEHKLTAHEIIILDQAAELEHVTADIRKNYVPMDYAIALQRAIEHHSKGKEVPADIAAACPHHADMLNAALKGGKG